MKRRVVVTGIGLITPLGLSIDENWKALCEGRSGISRITRFDPALFDSQIAGEVKGFEPASFIDKKEIKKMDLFIQYALSACQMAVKGSGIIINDTNAERAGVIVGVGIGGLSSIEKNHLVCQEKGPDRLTPFFIPMVLGNLVGGHISILYGAKGPNISIQTACASGSHAIGESYKLIAEDKTDIMISGGAEAAITHLGVGGFCAMKALSSNKNDTPEKASRPFDKNRDGFVIAEGAGIVILEEFEHAKRRGADIYGELIGYGLSADAYHITSPSPDGEGAARCMRSTLEDAKLPVENINYINAHGTSTFYGDDIETKAIKAVFKDHAYKLSVSSTKSMTGHLLGAAGGVEAIYSLLAIRHGIIPPTINYEEPDPSCDLDYVPNTARDNKIDYVLSNSFGFGGTNASLIFKRV